MTKFRHVTEYIPILLLFINKYKVPWIAKWQYHMASLVLSKTIQLSPVNSSQALVTHHNQLDIVTRHYFIKWWDSFKEERIIEQVQKEFLTSLNFPTQNPISSSTVPPMVKAPDSKNKAKLESNSKSNKSKSSLTLSLNLKKC